MHSSLSGHVLPAACLAVPAIGSRKEIIKKANGRIEKLKALKTKLESVKGCSEDSAGKGL
jgi:hypothetical protein